MTDLAHLLAEHPNVEPTILTTPANAALIRPSLAFSVKLLTYPFPSVGLPSGVENLSTASSDESWHIEQASLLARGDQESLIRAYKPDVVIADPHFTSISSIAAELSIMWFSFHAIGIFPQLVIHNLLDLRSDIISHKKQDPYECFGNVPGIPGPQISMPPSELPDFLVKDDFTVDVINEILQTRTNNESGPIVNTFYDLESEYYEVYKKLNPNSYLVGPLGLSTSDNNNRAIRRGGKGDLSCFDWLDSKDERSVIFVCFGSWCHFTAAQLCELALGLEDSGVNFLWAVRGGKDSVEAEWMPEGWEQRVELRGLVVRGWIPQVLILRHISVGAFLTHCGWNSVLEAVTTGTPMLTWPLTFEQFITERLVVEVKQWGVRIWEGGRRSAREEEKELVSKNVIANSMSEFMQPGGAGERARFRACEIAIKAKTMMNDHGGSSRRDLGRLIDTLLKKSNNK
ncbi:hypothetical protein LUZ60_017773 [Juncus effusus]|nr:hypothetical protein LUZ60_017773 [Juncus effusus]